MEGMSDLEAFRATGLDAALAHTPLLEGTTTPSDSTPRSGESTNANARSKAAISNAPTPSPPPRAN
jgi:hypothetical protein